MMRIGKVIFAAMVAVVCATAFARTSNEVRDEISNLEKTVEALRKEQRDLERKPVVTYTKDRSRTGNIIRRMGNKIEINEYFDYRYGHNEWLKWTEYKAQIPESAKRLARIEEIKQEIKQLKDQISELNKERVNLVREEQKANTKDQKK